VLRPFPCWPIKPACSKYGTIDNTTLEACRIKWPPLRNHIPCMADAIQLALGAVISTFSVTDPTRAWETNECDQQFGENESISIGKNQKLWNEKNARINKVLDRWLGLSKIIEKGHISRYFECPETDYYLAENACYIEYTDTWSSKRDYSLTQRQILHGGPT